MTVAERQAAIDAIRFGPVRPLHEMASYIGGKASGGTWPAPLADGIDAAARSIARIADDPKAVENAAVLAEWVAQLGEGLVTPAQFDGAVSGQAIFRACAVWGFQSPEYAAMVPVIERRLLARGYRWQGQRLVR